MSNLHRFVDGHRLSLLLLRNRKVVDNIRYIRACHATQPFQLFDESCQWIQSSICGTLWGSLIESEISIIMGIWRPVVTIVLHIIVVVRKILRWGDFSNLRSPDAWSICGFYVCNSYLNQEPRL